LQLRTFAERTQSVVTWGLEHRTLASIRAIGVDEIQYAKGHKYLTLVYQIDQGFTRWLWVGKERTLESFQGFFTVIGEQLASQIEFVCSDMWQPYLDVIRQKCSQALHILDRFHIVAKMNKALDEVRAAESRKMAQEGHPPLLKKSRWCVLKRKQNLTSQQKFRLRDLLRYSLQTVRAYLHRVARLHCWSPALSEPDVRLSYSSGSSPSNASFKETRFRYGKMLAVNSVVALWVKQDTVVCTRRSTRHSRNAIVYAPACNPGDLGVADGTDPALPDD
jgi:hypothetical protein